jgi:hypothetical protein
MEPEAVIRSWLVEDSFVPIAVGTFMKYFIIVAKDRDGRVRGVRDGTILLNQAHANDLCVVYLSHIYMLPDARGTVLSYWLRIAPVEIAVQFLSELHSRGLIRLPQPDKPSRHFGMRVNLTAEMEFFAPEDVTPGGASCFMAAAASTSSTPATSPTASPTSATRKRSRSPACASCRS